MKNLKNIIFAIKEIVKVSKSVFLMFLLFAVLSSVQTVIDLILIKFLIEYALSEYFVFSTLLFWLIGYFGLNFGIKLYLNIFLKVLIRKFEMKLTSYTNGKLYRKITELDVINYNRPEFYNKLHRAMEESELRYFLICMQFFSLMINCITCCSIFTFYHDFIIFVAVLFSVANYFWYYSRVNRKQYDFNKKEEPYDRLKEYLNRVFYQREYVEELRVSEIIKERLVDKFNKETVEYGKRYDQFLANFLRESILMTTVNSLFIWGVGLYISAQILGEKISVGDFVVMLNIVSATSDELIRLFKTIPDLYQSSLYMGDIREVLNESGSFTIENGLACEEFKNLEFRNVYFQYDIKSSFAIRAMDFSIDFNEVIAIVGLNGSGKSTLLDILMGLIQPDSGMVMLNGISYQQYNIGDVRKLFGVVFQDFQIYEISIAENILMREIISKDDVIIVEEALKYVDLYEKIKKLEKGIYSVLSSGEETYGFSGGELQRIAIARAYASKAQIFVFDEPMSNLDIYATQVFYDTMFRLKQSGKTVLFTTHKLCYATQADKIFYIQDGSLVEEGSHKELMNLGGMYAMLYKMQSNELFAGEVK